MTRIPPPHSPQDSPRRTARGLRLCAEWLAYCLRIGWHRNQLDELEALWWKYRDHNGDLIQTRTREK